MFNELDERGGRSDQNACHFRLWHETVVAVLSPQVRYEEVNRRSSVAIRGPSLTAKRHWLHAATEASCLLRDTRDCHDDREGRGGNVLRFIRAMPATQSRAMAAASS
jgi:hypothetical protein